MEIVHNNHEEYVRRLDHIGQLQNSLDVQDVVWYETNSK